MSKNSKGRGQINKMAFIEKKISYDDNGKKKKVLTAKVNKPRPTLNGNVYSIFPIPHEKPWWEDPSLTDSENDEARLSVDPEDYPELENMSLEDLIKLGVPISDMVRRKKRREGLESLVASAQIPSASIKDQFETYYRVLSRYFTPSDLRGKSLKELDRMLQMFINSNGGLF